MADPNIQTLIYPISLGGGLVKTYQTDVNKKTGSSITYDVTRFGQKDAVLRSEREVAPDGKIFYRTSTFTGSAYYSNLSSAEKKFIITDVAFQADNQRAAFINKNYTQDQINSLFPNMPGVRNTAPAPPQPPGQGGTPPAAPVLPPPEQAGPGQTGELAGKQLKVAGDAGLRYPKQISDEQDKIKFTACEINARTQPKLGPGDGSPGAGGLQTTFGIPTYTPVDGSVFLAIQSPISDQNSVDWGPDSVNAIDAALYNVSYGAITGGEGAVGNAIKSFLGGLYNTAQTEQGRFQRYLAGQAASINNVLARTDNVVLNPNLELLFQGPQLRPFTFQFKMSARNQDEANEIKSIIKYFKYHMAVRKETGLFLRAPHVFTIQYLKGNQPGHPGLNLISPSIDKKACALTNCSVDYTPLGSYMTYEDGTMTAYTLSLQFQEIEPIYDTDYTKEQPIGY